MFLTVELLYGTWGKKERKRMIASVISHTIRCENREHKVVY
jgi:hypothetical protein